MTTVAITAFVVLIVGIPVILANWDVIRRRMRKRRQHRYSAPPFLFFPTTGKTTVPAWHMNSAPAEARERSAGGDVDHPVRREPGIADLPAGPEQRELDIAALPPREGSQRVAWEKTVRPDPERRPHLESDD